ncbi:MAG TPA: glycosyl hydrolase [Microvirga sp.]|nr:glycosyl hydrolase [Microvirga sp.]
MSKAVKATEGKGGLGLWDRNYAGTAVADAAKAGFNWYYNWEPEPVKSTTRPAYEPSFVPMVWSAKHVTRGALERIKASGATTLLGFNEPNEHKQANMSVERAIALWPRLQATGLRLGSPSPSQGDTLGPASWLARFMAQAEKKGLRVDFIAVHYYSEDQDVGAFKQWLEAVHEQYKKPIWVTEWALADWGKPDRFSVEEQAAFARAGAEMLDDLPFVERHAWFAAYEGGDGWYLRSGVLDEKGDLTGVGLTFAELNGLTGANVMAEVVSRRDPYGQGRTRVTRRGSSQADASGTR